MCGLSPGIKIQLPPTGASPQVSFTVTGDLNGATSRGKDTICVFTGETPTLDQALPTLKHRDCTGLPGKYEELEVWLGQDCCCRRYFHLDSKVPVLGQASGAKSVDVI